MPRTPQAPELRGFDSYLDALDDQGSQLRERYRGDPEGLAERLGLTLPRKPLQVMRDMGVYEEERDGPITPGLRELVIDVCTLEVRSAVAVGPRGGGKSQGVSLIEFYLWMIEDFDALNLGGTELQAANVYTYLLKYMESDPYWKSLLKGDTKISESWNIYDAWIRVLTSSSRSVRSPHAGGWRMVNGERVERGGLLVIDEEAEAEDDIVNTAMYTINTARPSVNVRSSTFHNAVGSFAEVVDNHLEMGYAKYTWDAFDVAEPCGCTGGPKDCQSNIACFREDHVEAYYDEETGELKERLLHKAYCGGRAKYAEGWMRIEEIETIWNRSNGNHAKFEVEAMGSRPSTSGYVIRNMSKFNDSVSDKRSDELYIPGDRIEIDVDWGTVAAAVLVWQTQWRASGEHHVLLHADLVEEAGLTEILAVVLGYWARYEEAEEVAADIGGGGNYLNPYLRDNERIPTRDVAFQTEKEAAVAVWNVLSENGAVTISADCEEFVKQVKKWKRKNGSIVKGNDHLCDGAVCYFSRYIETFGFESIRTAPRTFSAGTDGAHQTTALEPARERSGGSGRPTPVSVRLPIVGGFRSS